MRFTLSFFFLLFSTTLLAQEQYNTVTFVYKGNSWKLSKRQHKVAKAMDETKIERIISFEYKTDALHVKANRIKEIKKLTNVSFEKITHVTERPPSLKKRRNRRVTIVYKATPYEWKNVLKGVAEKPMPRNDYEGFNCKF
jgi:hypothetical protein